MTDRTVGLSVSGVAKAFNSNVVLRGVDLEFERGTIHALLGPNGAGKSTLIGCLSGAVRPDAGHIRVGYKEYDGFTPPSAIEAGIATIYQHFQLIPSLSVSDNIFLGSELTGPAGTIRYSEQAQITRELLNSLGAEFSPGTLVQNLSTGQQQLVEIARALKKKPSILILDEPTAALGENEVEALLDLVTRLAHDQGLTIIYVTHLLREVLQVAHGVTVIRDGNVAWTRDIEDVTMEDLVAAIAPDARAAERDRSRLPGAPMLRLTEFEAGLTRLDDFTVHEHEIIGIYGLLGSGRTGLVEALAGVRAYRGTIELGGSPVTYSTPLAARRAGLVLVAADRKVQSLFIDMTAEENLLLPHYSALSKPLRSRRRERSVFDGISAQVKLHPRSPNLHAGQFSGGNAQKLAVGRWLTEIDETRILLLDEPTQGVDVGSRREIYELLRGYASKAGRAVIFTSSDPDEIALVADRVIVLDSGDKPPRIVDSSVGDEALLSLVHGNTLHPTNAGEQS